MQQTIRTGNVYSAIVFQNRLKTRGQKKVIIIKKYEHSPLPCFPSVVGRGFVSR